ncbi:MAG: phosphoglucomutase/phosphomannomutase family protein, partial [Coriobacteriales bacterium]|nr:phosphoglucomutase/phosphomannomutase family protein [Coriobacteriales bacterium]
DGDRLCAIDSQGRLVNPHRILMLIIQYLAGKGAKGRVVSTFSASTMVRLQCKRFGLPYTETPVGFKWIYQEMLKGDVIVGGEESGGIGIPQHVCERDGLLMALLLCELMATTGMNLDQLLAQTYEAIGGEYHYKRRDLRVTQPIKERFLAALPTCAPTELAGQPVLALSRADGIRFDFPAGAWLLMRTSGTEPLVRIYAESLDPAVMEALLDAGQELVEGA